MNRAGPPGQKNESAPAKERPVNGSRNQTRYSGENVKGDRVRVKHHLRVGGDDSQRRSNDAATTQYQGRPV